MEDGLRVSKEAVDKDDDKTVLILVLMEDGLRGLTNITVDSLEKVLILVLMEDGLRDVVMFLFLLN